MISAFPKIFSIGQTYIEHIFDDEVEITEKIDGSQFVFGKINGEIFVRSKGKEMFLDNYEKMFSFAVLGIAEIQDRIRDNTIYYCEYLRNPKHNILTYGRIPKNHLILFGVADNTQKFISKWEDLKQYAEELDIEVVPLIFKGKINEVSQLLELLDRDSVLGNVKIEGIVIKNYYKPFLLGGQPIPLMSGKYVSEKFKETHRTNWSKENTSRGQWGTFLESFRTQARWDKAIQHLKDNGELTNSPKDIGKLLKEIQIDIEKEEKEDILKFLWKTFKGEILRKSVSGFPEYYKEKLLKDSLNKE